MRKSLYIGYKGRKEAYIYIWFSKEYRFVYVGETANTHGVIGRANQHVEIGEGTLYSRVYDEGYELDDINDFVLLSYSLPRERRFLSDDSGFRTSVEYLIQQKLIEARKNVSDPYKCISNVSTGPYLNLEYIRRLAERIKDDLIDVYTHCS